MRRALVAALLFFATPVSALDDAIIVIIVLPRLQATAC